MTETPFCFLASVGWVKAFQFFATASALLCCLCATHLSHALENYKLPARHLLEAIKTLEAQDHFDEPLAPYLHYRAQNPQAAAIEWDASASPLSAKSWLLLNLDDAILERLKKNIDEKGQPLL